MPDPPPPHVGMPPPRIRYIHLSHKTEKQLKRKFSGISHRGRGSPLSFLFLEVDKHYNKVLLLTMLDTGIHLFNWVINLIALGIGVFVLGVGIFIFMIVTLEVLRIYGKR